ncbi:hypothetical protein E2C01_013885 [Portunus trituberculatus]|uniref:Uncharacterized protein n=1 Tax=Portunus trituberculatus TaxID=210409 RepID=A0A5B7DHE3_PORTR|nr:hypothetical protein [Portunus trituberculatus]
METWRQDTMTPTQILYNTTRWSAGPNIEPKPALRLLRKSANCSFRSSRHLMRAFQKTCNCSSQYIDVNLKYPLAWKLYEAPPTKGG